MADNDCSQRLVTVIVPCRNEVQHIRQLLECLEKQQRKEFDIEVIVADGMSDDGTRIFLETFALRKSWCRVIDNPQQIVSTGLNAAIKVARGEVIIRLDVHTTYALDYLNACVETLVSTGADCVGGPWVPVGTSRLSRAIAAGFRSTFGSGGAKSHNPRHCGEVDTVYLGCWKQHTLVDVGLFDESLVRNQDDELNLRLKNAGGRIWQSPRIRSWYAPREDLKALFRQYFQYGFWKVAVIRKHRRVASWRHLAPAAFLVAIAGLPIGAFLLRAFGYHSLGSAVLATWGALLVVYLSSIFFASLKTARSDGWPLFVFLPLVFMTFHFSYGLGFLRGLAHWSLHRSARTSTPPRYADLTR